MIYINYDGPASLMLHTKFRRNRPTGSGEEDFFKGFAIYSHGGHLDDLKSAQVCPIFKKDDPFVKKKNIAL